MAEQKITLIIDEEGAVSAKTEGFKGETCLAALEQLLEEQPIATSRTTDEFNQSVTVQHRQTIQQGKR